MKTKIALLAGTLAMLLVGFPAVSSAAPNPIAAFVSALRNEQAHAVLGVIRRVDLSHHVLVISTTQRESGLTKAVLDYKVNPYVRVNLTGKTMVTVGNSNAGTINQVLGTLVVTALVKKNPSAVLRPGVYVIVVTARKTPSAVTATEIRLMNPRQIQTQDTPLSKVLEALVLGRKVHLSPAAERDILSNLLNF